MLGIKLDTTKLKSVVAALQRSVDAYDEFTPIAEKFIQEKAYNQIRLS